MIPAHCKRKISSIIKKYKENKNFESATTRNSQCVKLSFVKKTQNILMSGVPPRNLSSNFIKRYLLMSALPFSPNLPIASIVGYFEMKLSLILMYTGFFSSTALCLIHLDKAAVCLSALSVWV